MGLFTIGFLNGYLSSGTGLLVTIWMITIFNLSFSVAVGYTLILVGIFWNGIGALSLGLSGNIVWNYIPALILGSIIGYLLARFKKLDYFFDSWVIVGLNIPAIVLVILFYIWLGLNEIALISAVVLNKIPIVIVNIREGTRSMDKSYFQIAKVYQLNNFQIWRKIILPQLYPYLMSSARTGLSLIWKIVLVFELLGRGSGIGFQLQVFFSFFDISSLLAYSIFFMSGILLIENYIMIPIEKKATHWRKL